jgi:hypothetical protein
MSSFPGNLKNLIQCLGSELIESVECSDIASCDPIGHDKIMIRAFSDSQK